MLIYLYLFLPPVFLSVESSSIRGRNNKNELVPLTGSRLDRPEADNNLKVVSSEPFIIQLHVPRHNDSNPTREKEKKRKRPAKKRVSKLRKKHRTRRDLIPSRLKHGREEKPQPMEIPLAANATEETKNATKNSIDRVEILKALSLYSKKNNSSEADGHAAGNKNDAQKPKQTHSDKNPLVKMIYPNTPKLDRHSHRYTYKDLMADRKRLEQKINYIKNMFSANDTDADDAVRIRRRSESDRTANKIAKMFLTLSAVNGLHDRRRSRCRGDDDDDDDENDGDRVQDIWEKEQRSSPNRKASSSNAERYKVKKWIEFMKNKRSSGKMCPCMGSVHGDDSEAFPLEQKLPKDYFLMERSRSSEESSETYRDPYYHPRERPYRRRFSKDNQDNKLKALPKNGKKKLDLPLTDLELYRSRAKQILQNAEDILDKIKEEEEKRLSAPSILMSQLKELTSRIQSDPRNNENDLIRKIQKNLGWKPLAKSKDGSDGNAFVDNVKSYILDPYEKAKALTDESTKMLSSYLLRNLGKVQQSSEEQPDDEVRDPNDNSRVYFGQVPTKEEEKPLPANLAKENPDLLSRTKQELENWEDTISTIMRGADEAVQEVPTRLQEDVFKNKMEDMMKEQQKKLNDYETFPSSGESSREAARDDKDRRTKPGIKLTKPEKHPLRLKLKDGNEKDPTGSHIKGNSKFPPHKTSKPEKDALGRNKHSFRLKPNPHEQIKTDRPKGNHHKANTKGSKKVPKGSIARESEDPDAMDPKDAEELGKEILEEIVKTLEKDEAPAESVAEEHEATDPQVRERLKPFGEVPDEPKLQQEEILNSNETPLQASLNLGDETVEEQRKQDGNLEPEMTNGGEDSYVRPNQSGLVSLPDDEDGKPIVSETVRETPEVNSFGPNYPPDYDFLSEDETPEMNGNLKDTLRSKDPKVHETIRDPSNVEMIQQTQQNDPDAVLQETQPKYKEDPQSDEETEDDLKPERQDAKNSRPQHSDEVRAALHQDDEESSEEVGKSESEEDMDNDDPLKGSLKLRENSEETAVPEEDSPEIGENVALESAKSGSMEDSDETPLKEALENEDEDDKLRETLKNKEEDDDDDDDEAPLRKVLKKQEDTPLGTNSESGEEKENDEESRSRKALDKEKEEKYENPLRKSLGNIEDKDEVPLRKTLESTEDDDDDDDVDSPLGKTTGNDKDKEDKIPLRKTLESTEDDDDDSPLKKQEDKYDTPLRQTLGNSEDEDKIPLRKTLESTEDDDDDDDVDDDRPLGKTMGNAEGKGDRIPLRKTLESTEDDDDSPLKKQEDKYDTPLRQTLGNSEDEDKIPLRKTMESKEDEKDEDDDSPLRQTLGKRKDEDKIPLKKTMESKEDEDNDDDDSPLTKQDKYDSPLSQTLGKGENKDKIPLRKTMERKEAEKDEDDVESPSKKQEDKYDSPLSQTFGNVEDKDKTPLRKTMESKEGEKDEDDDNPMRKQEDTYDGPLRETLESKEDEDDSPLSKTMGSMEDKEDQIPLRKTLESKEDDDDDSPLKKQKGKHDSPLSKTMGSMQDKDDQIPLRKTLESNKDEENEYDDETPLRKALERKEAEKDEDDDDVESPSKQQEDTYDGPLRETLERKEDEDDSPLKKQEDKHDSPSSHATGSTEDEQDQIPLRKTLERKEDEENESPLRKASRKQEDTFDTLEKKEDKDEDEDNIDDDIPLKESLKNRQDEEDNDEGNPVRMNLKKQDDKYDDPLANTQDKDETPLRKTLDDKEDEGGDSDETPLRKTFEKEENESDEIPLKKNLENTEDDETPLREALEDKENDDGTLENPTEETNNPPKANTDQSILKEANGQPEETSASEEDEAAPLREVLEEKNGNRRESSEEDRSVQEEDNELQEARADATFETDSDAENSDETTLRAVGLDQDAQDGSDHDKQYGEPNLKSVHPTKEDETSEEAAAVAANRKDPEVDEGGLPQSAEDAKNPEDGYSLRAEKPDEETNEEIPLRSTLDDDSLENVLEKTNGETEEPQSEENPEEKSEEALRLAPENVEEANDDSPLKSIDQEVQQTLQNENESDETVKATVQTSEEGDEPEPSVSNREMDEEGPLKGANPSRTGSREKNENEQFDDPQNEETPLRVSLNQDDSEGANNSDEDTENPLGNRSLENELDSKLKETPLAIGETQEDDSNGEDNVRAEDTHNQIDGNEDETSKEDDSTENKLREDNPVGQNLQEDDREGDRGQSSLPDLLELPEKAPKPGKLKVPKSIGEIMKDLDGREKEDITALRNLNPDKIDDIIDKLDEAEQVNLREDPDVDCRKECACADEIDTRSRNIGRYEIVKDFLRWMKDLQLNRVLTDD